MADEIPELQDEPSALERFFTFLSRPYYVGTSLLGGAAEALGRGDPTALGRGLGDAIENSVMFGEELATGSWAHGKHLTNLLPGVDSPYGLTEKKERPELSDVLHRGNLPFAPKRGSTAELLTNIVGGAVLDPLTYVGGVGLGAKAGRVAKGAATGLGAVGHLGEAATAGVARAIENAAPKAWAARLAAAGDDVTEAAHSFYREALNHSDNAGFLRSKLAEEEARVMGQLGELPDVMAAAHRYVSPDVPYEEALRLAAREEAHLRLGVDPFSGRFTGLTGRADQAELLDEGTRWLEKQKLLKPAGVPTLELGDVWTALPGSAEAWGRIGLAAPVHLAAGALNAGGQAVGYPGLGDALREAATNLADGFGRTFYDRTLGLGNDALRAATRQIAGETFAAQAARVPEVGRIFEGASPELTNLVGSQWLKYSDDFGDLAVNPWWEPARVERAAADVVGRFGGDRAAVQARADALLPWATPAKTGLNEEQAKALRLMFMDARERVAQVAVQAGHDPALAQRILDGYVDAVRKLPEELVEVGRWSEGRATPFYVPHQATDDLARFMAAGNPGKKLGGQTYESALRSVFERRRDYTTLADWRAELARVAKKYGVDDVVGSGVETDLSKLLLRRLWAHDRTIGNHVVERVVKEAFPGARFATTAEQFLDAQLRPLGVRQNALSKILGGGEFRVGGAVGKAGASLKNVLGGAPGAVGDEAGWVYQWPGINAIVKPLLYLGAMPLPAVSSFVRNGVGGVVNSLLDPSIGLAGAAGIATSLRDLPIVKALMGAPNVTKGDIGLALRAIKAKAPGAARLSPEELNALQQIQVGKYSLADLVEHMAAGVVQPRGWSDKELFEQIGSVPRYAEIISREGGPDTIGSWWAHLKDAAKGEFSTSMSDRALETFRAYMRPLAAVNDAIENGLRGGSFLALVKKGYSPAEAAKKVAEQFVDYGYVSATERMVRDLFPFARYQIGVTPVAVKGALSPAGRAVSRAVTTPDDATPLPPEIRGQTTIPYPGGPDAEGNARFFTSLGLPFESAADSLALLTPWKNRAAERTLGSLNPILKTGPEMALDRSFFRGRPISEGDRGPDWLPSWAPGVTVETLPSGREIKRVPPFVAHALLGFLPVGRLSGELDKWTKVAHGDYANLVNALSGVKLRTVDGEREAEKLVKRVLQEYVESGDLGSVQNFFVKGAKDRELDPRLKAALEQLEKAKRAKR